MHKGANSFAKLPFLIDSNGIGRLFFDTGINGVQVREASFFGYFAGMMYGLLGLENGDRLPFTISSDGQEKVFFTTTNSEFQENVTRFYPMLFTRDGLLGLLNLDNSQSMLVTIHPSGEFTSWPMFDDHRLCSVWHRDIVQTSDGILYYLVDVESLDTKSRKKVNRTLPLRVDKNGSPKLLFLRDEYGGQMVEDVLGFRVAGDNTVYGWVKIGRRCLPFTISPTGEEQVHFANERFDGSLVVDTRYLAYESGTIAGCLTLEDGRTVLFSKRGGQPAKLSSTIDGKRIIMLEQVLVTRTGSVFGFATLSGYTLLPFYWGENDRPKLIFPDGKIDGQDILKTMRMASKNNVTYGIVELRNSRDLITFIILDDGSPVVLDRVSGLKIIEIDCESFQRMRNGSVLGYAKLNDKPGWRKFIVYPDGRRELV